MVVPSLVVVDPSYMAVAASFLVDPFVRIRPFHLNIVFVVTDIHSSSFLAVVERSSFLVVEEHPSFQVAEVLPSFLVASCLAAVVRSFPAVVALMADRGLRMDYLNPFLFFYVKNFALK